jgi:uncharacterized membrane protein YcaP (DUF421 family)
MDAELLRIAVRIVCVYVLMLVLIRLSGKRTVQQGSPFDFTIALILGDMVDDAIWAEVPAAQFIVAAAALSMIHLLFDLARYRAGSTG